MYDPEVKESRIVKLANSSGIWKVSHHMGNMIGCKVEWEGESVAWKENEYWSMKATNGMFARLSMQAEMHFEDDGSTRTNVTFRIGYHVPSPIAGPLIDRLFIRREVHQLARTALEGLQRAALLNKIPFLSSQLEKRMEDHPAYISQNHAPLDSARKRSFGPHFPSIFAPNELWNEAPEQDRKKYGRIPIPWK